MASSVVRSANGTDDRGCRVLLRDPIPARAHLIEEVIHSALVDTDVAAEGVIPEVTTVALAVVGLASVEPTEDEIACIERLHTAGMVVLTYAAGASTANLSARCKLLLAGGQDLFDAADSGFFENLRDAVRAHVIEQASRSSEKKNLIERMLRYGAVGQSETLLAVFRAIDRVSTFTNLPVLVTGETGTGKELVAAAIHGEDRNRAAHAFVAVNCATLNSDLSGSELFGHRKGSYTGAIEDRRGLFRAANGGTIFLDEVGELVPQLQAKLLRVLQIGSVLGVGEDREIPVEVRVIAATNRDLKQMVSDGTFREDLYHRLNVANIHVPPLRDRREDIPLLVEHFLAHYGAGKHGSHIEAAPDFLEALQWARFPGNVRQLENLIRHALVRRKSAARIDLADLPNDLLHELAANGNESPKPTVQPDGVLIDLKRYMEENEWSLERSLAQFERLAIAVALELANGNRTQAARRLGITPRTIYNKLQRGA